MSILLLSMAVLGGVGLCSAIILYFVSQKFKVEEDERIDAIEALLPGANCGGCGSAGCRDFAKRCVNAGNLEGLCCPVAGNEGMQAVAAILGIEAVATTPRIAVIRCNGDCEARPKTNYFDGASSCALAESLYIGETACAQGCLGLGDCANACQFGAISINTQTGLPEVDENRCGGCGSCTAACPRHIIELRKKGPKSRRIYVACANTEKGAIARKACQNACIGCSKCVKECNFEAISLANNLAYVDDNKCRLCTKCAQVCPTGALKAINFPKKNPEL